MNTTKSLGAGLTKLQYRTCRDAGFTADELSTKGRRWYNANVAQFNYDHADDPAHPKQLEFFEQEQIDNPIEDISFGEARTAIRNYEKSKGADQLYIDGILAYEADNEKRNKRKRTRSDNTGQQEPDRTTTDTIGTNRTPSDNNGHVRTESDTNGKPRIVPAKVELPKLAQSEIKLPAKNSAWNDDPFFDQFTEEELA